MGHWRQPVLLFILPKKIARNERFLFISCGFLLWTYVKASLFRCNLNKLVPYECSIMQSED